MATVSTFNVALVASTGRFITAIARADRQWNQFARSVQRHAKTMPEAIRKATAPSLALGRQVAKAVAVGTAALSGMAGLGVKLAAEYEQTTIAFETLLGSAEAADRFLRELDVFARRTPFDPDQLRQSARQLLAFGFAGDQVLKMLTPIGDAVAAMGGDMEVMDRIIRAIGQIAAKQRVQSEELLQLTEAGIPAWRYLAEALDTTVADAMERVTKRQVDAATAINAILRGMAKDFGGAMERQSRTILGQWEQVKEGLSIITRGVGQDIIRIFGLAGAMQALNNALGRFADAVARSGSFLYALRTALPPWLPVVIFMTAGAIVGALVPAITAWLIPALRKLGQSLIAVLAPLRVWMAAGAAVGLVAWIVIKNWRLVPAALKLFAYSAAAAIVEMAAMGVRAVAWLLGIIGYIIPWARSASAYLYGLSARMEGFAVRLVRTGYAAWTAAKAAGASVGRLRELERVTNGAAKGAQRLGDAARRAADAQEKLAKGLKSAGKAAADNLQSFDEVHRIETEMGDAGGGAPVDIPAVQAYQDWANLLDQIAGSIGNIGTAMQNLAGGMAGPTGQLLSLWEEIKRGAQDLWDKVVYWWEQTKNGVINRVKEIWSNVTTWWQRTKDSVVTKVQEIWSSVTKWWDNIKTSVVTRVQGIWSDVTTWWQNIKNSVVTKVVEIWTGVTTWWQNIKNSVAEKVMGILTDVTTWWSNIKNSVLTKVQGIWSDVTTWWGNIKGEVLTKLQGIWADVTTWWGNIKQEVLTRVQGIRTDVATWWGKIKADVLTKVQGIWGDVTKWWDNIKADLGTRLEGVYNSVTTKWQDIKNEVYEKAYGIRDDVVGAMEKLKERWDEIWGGIKKTASNIGQEIKETVRGVVNGVIGFINRLIRAINNIRISLPAVDIPFVGRVGGWTISFVHIPEIPYLARGGDITGSGLAVVGEAGPELLSLPRGARVTPLSGGGDIEDAVYRAVYQALVDALSERAAEADQAQEVVLRVDGRTLGRVTLPHIIAEAQRMGLNLVLRPQGV